MTGSSGLHSLKTLSCFAAVTFFSTSQACTTECLFEPNVVNIFYLISMVSKPLFFIIMGYIDELDHLSPAQFFAKVRSVLGILIFWSAVLTLLSSRSLEASYLLQSGILINMAAIYFLYPFLVKGKDKLNVLILLVLVGFLGLLTFDVLRASTPDAGIDIYADYTSVWVWPGYYILGHVFAGKPFRRFMNNPAITKLAKILLFPALMSLYFSELYLVNHQIVYVSLWLLLEHSQLFILCTILFIIFNCTAIKSKAIKKTINFMGPTMVGVYIIHYSVYYILVRVYELFNLGITLHSLVLVFLLSVVISRLLSQNKYTSKIITF